jgi:hypothetical protein
MPIDFKAATDTLVTSTHNGTATTEGVFINNEKVLGRRGAAVANATDATTVITQLNLLLARCRDHGLIAP